MCAIFSKYKEKEEISKAINEVSFLGGTTATNDALILADTEVEEARGARPGVAEPIVIVFTDGYSQQDPQPGPVCAAPFLNNRQQCDLTLDKLQARRNYTKRRSPSTRSVS
jgi:hypothetical protein